MERRCHAGCATGTLYGDPHAATKRVRGVPKWSGGDMWAAPLGPFGGAPDGATKRATGVPKWSGGAIRAAPLGP
eukprot:1669022-Pyramimonas_sp.AAC.1